MRSIVLPFIFCLTVWAVALAQGDRIAQVSVEAPHPLTPGRLITVKIQGAPEMTRAAFFDLGPQIRGLQLYPVGGGTWEGSFAVLPSMVGQQFQATANLYDAKRKAIPVRDSQLVLEVASPSQKPGYATRNRGERRALGMIGETSGGRVAVAFDTKIRLDTIQVRTLDQVDGVRPELRNNYLVLPEDIESADVVSVTALNLQNQPVVLYGPASTALSAGAR